MPDTAIERLPRHLAVIMDGNGRWAKKRHLSRTAGHKAGFDNFVDLVAACDDLKIPYLTIYAFSTENWKRERDEVDTLLRLMNKGIRDFTPTLVERNIRLRILGALEMFPEEEKRVLDESVARLAGNTGMTLAICLSYGGREELVHAVNALLAEGVEHATEEALAAHLYSAGMPDPDLIIRTSGEYRLSNFLLWQSAYAEYYFTDTLWPDFKEKELEAALRSYAGRSRRFGGA